MVICDPTPRITSKTPDSIAPVWTVVVTWAFQHPPTWENSTQSTVLVAAATEQEAALIAAQMVACRRECVMPTRTAVVR